MKIRRGSGGALDRGEKGVWWCTKLKMKDEEEGDLVVVVVVDWWWTKATCRVQVAGWVFAAGASTCLLLSSVVLRITYFI